MKPIFIGLAFACWIPFAGFSQTLHSSEANRIADAIYRVEGGPKAKVPYGILSVKVSGHDEARRVCLNTINNNHRRWLKAGKPGRYLDFLADRYCPPSVDPVGNANWKRNITAILNQK